MGFSETAFEASSYQVEQLIGSDLPEIVFSGRSNVGKSSMINKLANRKKLARVSAAPGKTASVNFYRCGGFRLVDLPGYGFARVSHEEKEKWAALVEGFFAQNRRIVLVIQLVDARHGPSQYDLDMLAYLQKTSLTYIVAETKCDKLNKSEFAARREAAPVETGLPDDKIVFFSSETGEGAEALEKLIRQRIAQAE